MCAMFANLYSRGVPIWFTCMGTPYLFHLYMIRCGSLIGFSSFLIPPVHAVYGPRSCNIPHNFFSLHMHQVDDDQIKDSL